MSIARVKSRTIGLEGLAEELIEEEANRAEIAVVKVALHMVTALQRRVQPPPKRTGRIYTRNGITWQASSEDQSPAKASGDLQRSIKAEIPARRIPKGNQLVISAAYKVTAVYAAALEWGTLAIGGWIAPRPYVRPTEAAEEERVNALLEG